MSKLTSPSGKQEKTDVVSCVFAELGAGRDALSALDVASASEPPANGSLRAQQQQAAEPASSFLWSVSPKNVSLPQRDFTAFQRTRVTHRPGVGSDHIKTHPDPGESNPFKGQVITNLLHLRGNEVPLSSTVQFTVFQLIVLVS